VAELEKSQSDLLERLGVESLDDVAELDPKGQAEAVKQYEARMKKMQRELEEAAKSRDEIAGKYRGAQLSAQLEKALGAHEWLDRDIVAHYMQSGVEWEDDQPLFKADGKLIPLSDGVEFIAKSKPHLIKTGAGGSGYRPPSDGARGSKTMTRQQFDGLDASAKAEAVKSRGARLQDHDPPAVRRPRRKRQGRGC